MCVCPYVSFHFDDPRRDCVLGFMNFRLLGFPNDQIQSGEKNQTELYIVTYI